MIGDRVEQRQTLRGQSYSLTDFERNAERIALALAVPLGPALDGFIPESLVRPPVVPAVADKNDVRSVYTAEYRRKAPFTAPCFLNAHYKLQPDKCEVNSPDIHPVIRFYRLGYSPADAIDLLLGNINQAGGIEVTQQREQFTAIRYDLPPSFSFYPLPRHPDGTMLHRHLNQFWQATVKYSQRDEFKLKDTGEALTAETNPFKIVVNTRTMPREYLRVLDHPIDPSTLKQIMVAVTYNPGCGLTNHEALDDLLGINQ